MSRKANFGIDYDEDYDIYEDYTYDNYDGYDYDAEEASVIHESKPKQQDTVYPGVWRCPICTFDNDDSMTECEICGVLRNPLIRGSSKNNANTAAPFKFDVPSPDDLVSNGMHSSRLRSKVDLEKILSSDIPASEKDRSNEDASHSMADKPQFGSERHSSSSASASKGRLKDIVISDSSSETGDRKTGLTSKISNVSLLSKPGKADNINGGRSALSSKQRPAKQVSHDELSNRKSQLNLAIIGHVDSGKSTLSGRLLHLLGQISQKEMHKYEKEAKQQGKGSFAYAWALDESAEERERGITMTVAVAYFDSKKYRVVLLDSPGHRDFVPNMISGATQADAAILVIDASIGSFEAGLDVSGGQTREHAQLIRSFGVDQIIIAVNKMDAIDYSRERFDMIKKQLGTFLRACGFKDSSVLWVPISAMENQNLVAAASDAQLLSWFQGPCLLDAIDSLQPPVRDNSKPLLMPICDVIKSQSQGQASACGKLETGTLHCGMKVLVMPSRELATVRSIELDSQACNNAKAGDNVTVSLQGIDGNRVMAGGVLCHPDFPVAVTNHLELKVVVLDTVTPILIGSQLELHIHHAKDAARVVRILSLLDPKTGQVMKKSPRCILAKQNAIIEVVLQEEVCVEEYSNCKALGRVSLRASGRTVALGLVTRIIQGEV